MKGVASTGSSVTRPLSGLQKEVLSLYRVILREAVKKDRGGDSKTVVPPNKGGPSLEEKVLPSTTTTRLSDLLWNSEKQSTSRYARDEFRKQVQKVDRKDFRLIESRIRHGHKQVKLLQMPGVKVVSSSSTASNR